MARSGSGNAPGYFLAVARSSTSGTHAWSFARLQYGEGSKRAERWVHQIAEDLRAGKVQKVIARLERLQPSTVEARKCLQELIATTATMPAACDTTSICV